MSYNKDLLKPIAFFVLLSSTVFFQNCSRSKLDNSKTLSVKQQSDDEGESSLGRGAKPKLYKTGWRTNEKFSSFRKATINKVTGIAPRKTQKTKVDNSLSEFFPKIRDQGSEGSCTAFSAVYYTFSYEFCKANPNYCEDYCGLNREQCTSRSCDESKNVNVCKKSKALAFSPRFSYNLANQGVDEGSFVSEVIKSINKFGALTWAEMPYQSGQNDYQPSFLVNKLMSSQEQAKLFIQAASRTVPKIDQSIGIQIEMKNEDQIKYAKQVLAEGHLLLWQTLVFGSDMYSCVSNKKWVQDINCNIGNSELNQGEFANFSEDDTYVYMNKKGSSGGHALTVVGYDDQKWFTISGKNFYGGFKIANSWGSDTGKKGFFWVPYELFRNKNMGPFLQINVPIYRNTVNINDILYVKSEKAFNQINLIGSNTGKKYKVFDYSDLIFFPKNLFDPGYLKDSQGKKVLYFTHFINDVLKSTSVNDSTVSVELETSAKVVAKNLALNAKVAIGSSSPMESINYNSEKLIKYSFNNNEVYSLPESISIIQSMDSQAVVERAVTIVNFTNSPIPQLKLIELNSFIDVNDLKNCNNLKAKSSCEIHIKLKNWQLLEKGLNNLCLDFGNFKLPIQVYLIDRQNNFEWTYPTLGVYAGEFIEFDSTDVNNPTIFKFPTDDTYYINVLNPDSIDEDTYELELGYVSQGKKYPFANKHILSKDNVLMLPINADHSINGTLFYYTIKSSKNYVNITRFVRVEIEDRIGIRTTDYFELRKINDFEQQLFFENHTNDVGLCLIKTENDLSEYNVYIKGLGADWLRINDKPVKVIKPDDACDLKNAFFKFKVQKEWDQQFVGFQVIEANKADPRITNYPLTQLKIWESN